MIRGKENILSWFKSTNCNYWTIYRYGSTDGTKTVIESNRDESATADRAFAELNNALDLMDGKYSMACTAMNKRTTRQDFHEDIEVSKMAMAGISGPPVMQGLSKEEAFAMVQEGIKKFQTEERLKALEKENAELKKDLKAIEKEAGNPLNRIISIAGPYIEKMMLGTQQKIAGIPAPGHGQPNNDHFTNTPVEEQGYTLTDEENERLAQCIGIFHEYAPGEWLPLLEKLAAKIQENPAILNMLKSFL